jgi:hypothetical protein
VPRRSRLLAVASVAGLLLTGCGGIQARKERAERIIDSVDKAVAAKTAQVTLTAHPKLRLDRNERLAAGASAARATPTQVVSAQADLAGDRVAYLAPAADGVSGGAVVIYSGNTIFVRRAAQTAGAGASTQRPWVRLDLTTIDPDEIDNSEVEVAEAARRLQHIAGVDNPLFLLKLLRGTLTGSVDDLAEDSVRGVPTRHYRLNIDREKAVKDEDEDVQDAYEALFKTFFATRTVFPGEVWLDDEGVPRRYEITLKSSVRRHALADIELTVELFDLGQPVQIALPGKGETAKVDGLGSLVQALTGGGE